MRPLAACFGYLFSVGHQRCGRQSQEGPFPGQETLPPRWGCRATMGHTTRRGTVFCQRLRAPSGEVYGPPRPGQDDSRAATPPGLRTRGARPPVSPSRRVLVSPDHRRPVRVWRPHGASMEDALRAPDVALPPGFSAWGRARPAGRREKGFKLPIRS